MGKYITKSILQNLLDAVVVNDNEYISVDKLISLLRNVEGVEVSPIRKINSKIEALEHFNNSTESCITTNKSHIERYTAKFSVDMKITRRTMTEWEKSMRNLQYEPRLKYFEDYKESKDVDLIQMILFLKRMQIDQKR